MDITRFRTPSLMVSLIVVILACNIPGSEGLEASALPTATEEPVSPPTETPIQHVVVPVGLPADRSSHAGYYDSSTTAAIKQSAGGDRFTFGRLERPFNANTMDVYYPNLDIVDTFVFQDDTWLYGTIHNERPRRESSPAEQVCART